MNDQKNVWREVKGHSFRTTSWPAHQSSALKLISASVPELGTNPLFLNEIIISDKCHHFCAAGGGCTTWWKTAWRLHRPFDVITTDKTRMPRKLVWDDDDGWKLATNSETGAFTMATTVTMRVCSTSADTWQSSIFSILRFTFLLDRTPSDDEFFTSLHTRLVIRFTTNHHLSTFRFEDLLVTLHAQLRKIDQGHPLDLGTFNWTSFFVGGLTKDHTHKWWLFFRFFDHPKWIQTKDFKCEIVIVNKTRSDFEWNHIIRNKSEDNESLHALFLHLIPEFLSNWDISHDEIKLLNNFCKETEKISNPKIFIQEREQLTITHWMHIPALMTSDSNGPYYYEKCRYSGIDCVQKVFWSRNISTIRFF